MKSLTVTLSMVVCLIAAISINLNQAQTNVNEQIINAWLDFTATYNKTYSSEEEELTRFLVFAENYERIAIHNAEHYQGIHSYNKEINQFSDLVK